MLCAQPRHRFFSRAFHAHCGPISPLRPLASSMHRPTCVGCGRAGAAGGSRNERCQGDAPERAAVQARSGVETHSYVQKFKLQASSESCIPGGMQRHDSWLSAALAQPQQLLLGGACAAGLAAAAAGPAAAAVADLASAASGAGAFIPGIVGDDPLREGFVSALLLVFFSEIGDKTFFIALLLALQQPRGLVFGGTFGALAVMTVISVALGRFLHQLDELLPQSSLPLDDLLAVALLLWFGVSTLLDADSASQTAAEEKEEAQEVVDSFGSGEHTAAGGSLVHWAGLEGMSRVL